MSAETPFQMWSIVEAWDWLANLPVRGFAMLALLGPPLLMFGLLLAATFE